MADFSIPVLTDGKRPIVRCADKDRYVSVKDIDKPEVRVVVNPGGTNQRFADANFPHASVRVFPDNRAIFKEVAEGRADLMVTDGCRGRLPGAAPSRRALPGRRAGHLRQGRQGLLDDPRPRR